MIIIIIIKIYDTVLLQNTHHGEWTRPLSPCATPSIHAKSTLEFPVAGRSDAVHFCLQGKCSCSLQYSPIPTPSLPSHLQSSLAADPPTSGDYRCHLKSTLLPLNFTYTLTVPVFSGGERGLGPHHVGSNANTDPKMWKILFRINLAVYKLNFQCNISPFFHLDLRHHVII